MHFHPRTPTRTCTHAHAHEHTLFLHSFFLFQDATLKGFEMMMMMMMITFQATHEEEVCREKRIEEEEGFVKILF